MEIANHIAVVTKCLAQPLRRCLQTAMEIGAQGIQLDVPTEVKPADLSETGRRQFLHEANELNLSVASLNLSLQKALHDQERLEQRIASIKSAMQFAFQLKARVVTARIGRIPEDDGQPEYIILHEAMTELARHGNHVGVTFAITPTKDAPQSLADFVSSITSGPIGINFDPANFVMTGHDPSGAFRTLYHLVTHVRVRDAIRDIDGSGLEVPVGRGEVDWPEILALLEEANYRGWLTIDRTQGENRRDDVAHAIQYLRHVATGE